MMVTTLQKLLIALTAYLLVAATAPSAGGEVVPPLPTPAGPVPARHGRAKLALQPLTPPPGTLGRTYRRISQPVPADEHPRVGMLEICHVPAGWKVTIRGMEGFRGTDGIWYFKTKRPLIPCVPYIYTVRFHHGPLCEAAPGQCGPKVSCDYRVVRLIPGRIVYLKY